MKIVPLEQRKHICVAIKKSDWVDGQVHRGSFEKCDHFVGKACGDCVFRSFLKCEKSIEKSEAESDRMKRAKALAWGKGKIKRALRA